MALPPAAATATWRISLSREILTGWSDCPAHYLLRGYWRGAAIGAVSRLRRYVIFPNVLAQSRKGEQKRQHVHRECNGCADLPNSEDVL
eukprot:scaffold4569_cov174-Skeletonema_marinoi.AAC.5